MWGRIMENRGWYTINERELHLTIGSGEPIKSYAIKGNSFNNYLSLINKFCIPDGKNLVIFKDTGILLTLTVPENERAIIILKNTYNNIYHSLCDVSRKMYLNAKDTFINRIIELDRLFSTLDIFKVQLNEYAIELKKYVRFVQKIWNKWCYENISSQDPAIKIFTICYLAKIYTGKKVRDNIIKCLSGCEYKLALYIKDQICLQPDINIEFKDYLTKEFIIEFS